MVRQITGTIATRVFIAVMNLLTLMLAGNRLGAHGLGEIGLIVLGITFIMLPAGLIGGSTIVYLLPRLPLAGLLRPSYLWVCLVTVLAYPACLFLPVVPEQYALAVVLLAGMQGIYALHLNVLLGQQRIKLFNAINAVQALVLFVVFAVEGSGVPGASAMGYVEALGVSFLFTLVVSTAALVLLPPIPHRNEPINVLGFMWRQGTIVQLTNGVQLLTYRLSYLLIERFKDTALLGVYSVGNQLAESAWLGPRGLGTLLLSRISNTEEADRQSALTVSLGKLGLAFALSVVLLVIAIPSTWIQWLFGPEITGLRPIMVLLAPGILAMAASQAVSHYFSGIGRYSVNLVGSGIGVLVTTFGGWWLISSYGLHGAAITASLAYCASVCYQMIVFLRSTTVKIVHLLPTRDDVRRVRESLGTRK